MAISNANWNNAYKKGWFALRNAKPNINALMTVAVTDAFAISQRSEAAMVMALYASGEMIEAKPADRACNDIKRRMALTPDWAEMPMPVGSWQLAVGSWQLAVGSWQLAIHCHLMTVTWLTAAYKALVLLMIVSPCALVIFAPVT